MHGYEKWDLQSQQKCVTCRVELALKLVLFVEITVYSMASVSINCGGISVDKVFNFQTK
jgi:hypothetical protein